jgi:hypothetical protein
VLIFTNLLLLPVLLSYTGERRESGRAQLPWKRRKRPAARTRQAVGVPRPLHDAQLGNRRDAVSVALAARALAVSQRPQDPAISTRARPELRASSRYNQDTAYITAHYALSSDQFALIVKTGKGGLPQVRNARSKPTGWPGRCGKCRVYRRRFRSPTPHDRSPPARSRAIRSG